MVAKAQLETEDRNFFALVIEAILANPFLDERAEILTTILPRFTQDTKSREFKLMSIVPDLNERIGQLERKGLDQIQHFKEEDRRLLKDVFLLQEYLHFAQDFDKLIQNQLSLGQTPANVPFAEQFISQLKSRGFIVQECLHYLSLFFQFRRAFYFIDRALVGDSPSMKKLRHSLWNNVFTSDARTYDRLLWNRMEDFSTILLGETGTGKGSAAAAIGRSGFIPFDRKNGQFAHNIFCTYCIHKCILHLRKRISNRVGCKQITVNKQYVALIFQFLA